MSDVIVKAVAQLPARSEIISSLSGFLAIIEGLEMARLALVAFKQGSDIVADSSISVKETEIGRSCALSM